jgi:hypothetical protein
MEAEVAGLVRAEGEVGEASGAAATTSRDDERS